MKFCDYPYSKLHSEDSGLPNLPNKQQFDLNAKDEEIKRQNKRRKSLKIMVAGCTLILLSLIAIIVPTCIFGITNKDKKEYWFPSYVSDSELGVFKSAAVASDAAPCSPIGRQILEKNGSAVDAAIATLVCMGVVNPQSMGLGGGFFMLIYKRDEKKSYFIDAREKAPLKATERMFQGSQNLARYGGLSIAVPGELEGYVKAYQNFGKLPWRELIQPTIDLCNNGIKVSAHLSKYLRAYEEKTRGKEAWKIFYNNNTGRLYREGETMFRPDMAVTLNEIANNKGEALYNPNHPFAQKFMQDLKDMGSIITEEDMIKYHSRKKESLSVSLRNNFTLFGSDPPGSGALLSSMMNILNGYNITKKVTSSKSEAVLTLHRIIETFKFTYARRFELEDNKTTMPDFVAEITSKEYARKIRSKLDDSKTHLKPEYYGLNVSAYAEDHGTASMALIAPNGDAVVATSTVNLYFGSLEISKSTGIILNDEMDDFSSPDVVSYFDVPPSIFNRIRPERRPASSMCPTITVDADGNVRHVLSGNGGVKITTSILQVLLRSLWFGEDIKTSIDAPRLHHQLLPNKVVVEDNFPQDLIDELEAKGHVIEYRKGGMNGIIVGLVRDKDGKIYANSDFRKKGTVDGY